MEQPAQEDHFYWTRLSPPEMVTGNMFAVFYKDPKHPERDGECVIIDAGISLEGNNAGFKIPDTEYISKLRKGKSPLGKYNVVGVIISHGHDDHLAALPYVIQDLGRPKVYGFTFTMELCKLLVNYDSYKALLHVVDQTDNAIKLGKYFKAYLIYVTHSIPDASHVVLRIADKFTYYHGADFKLDPYPVGSKLTDMDRLNRFSKDKVDLLTVDCVRGTEPNFTPPETDVFESLQKEMRGVEGNIYVTTFSSHIHRMQQIVNAAVYEGRKIVLLGKSVRGKTELALNLKLLKIPKDFLLNSKQVEDYQYRDSNLCIIAAGCQGQSESAMGKLMTRGVGSLRIKSGDKVIISASCIPGNSKIYFSVVEQLLKRGIQIVYPSNGCLIHVSGHSSVGDLKRFVRFFKNASHLMPISGVNEHYLAFAKNVESLGYSVNKGNLLLPEAGQVLGIGKGSVFIADTHSLNMVSVFRTNDNQD